MGQDGDEPATVSRRSLLKGMGAAGLTAMGAGTLGGPEQQDPPEPAAGGTLDIALYKQREEDAAEAETIQDALQGWMDQLRRHGAVGETNVWVEDATLYDTFDIVYDDADCNDGSWFNAFIDDVGDAYDADAHIAVTDQTGFVTATNDECWGGNGPAFGYVGTAGDEKVDGELTQYEALAFQEVGHVAINEGHIRGSDDLDHPEHALGTIIPEGWRSRTGPVTPMAAFYANQRPGKDDGDNNPCATLGEATTKGVCSAPESVTWDGTYTRELTPCTIDAFRQTYIHDGYGPPSASEGD